MSSKIGDCADQPKGVTDLVVQGDVDDVEAWIKELYKPNFCTIHAITELKVCTKLQQTLQDYSQVPAINTRSWNFLNNYIINIYLHVCH